MAATHRGRFDPERFWATASWEGDCLVWKGSRPRGKYGRIIVDFKPIRAHRMAWVLTNGPIPAGLWVLHTCDNPPCINPAHLYLGTVQDNVRDRDERGRGADVRGERHWSARLTAEQVQQIRDRYAAGGVTFKSLGSEYGVSPSQVHRVVRHQRWA